MSDNRLVENLVHFSRLLRAAGLPAGPDRTAAALAALDAVGMKRRDDVRAALAAALVSRAEHLPLFDAAFDAFWRDPRLLEKMMYALLPKVEGRIERAGPTVPRRLSDALAPPREQTPAPRDTPEVEIEFDALLTVSDRERLGSRDFEQMSTREYDEALRLAREVDLPLFDIRSRRRIPALRGPLDLGAVLRHQARQPLSLAWPRSQRVLRAPPLVVLIDVSGSMSRYARVFLHFCYALTQRYRRVSVFSLATRLTNLSRCYTQRDPDLSVAAAARAVPDWESGTRLGECLREFNHLWSRRVLGQGAQVLLLSDGLERGDASMLETEAARLARSCRRLLWLNPLLRYSGFEPKAAGVRALLPHVDAMLAVHNLDSLAALSAALRAAPARTARAA